jgi:hypothetical protein
MSSSFHPLSESALGKDFLSLSKKVINASERERTSFDQKKKILKKPIFFRWQHKVFIKMANFFVRYFNGIPLRALVSFTAERISFAIFLTIVPHSFFHITTV